MTQSADTLPRTPPRGEFEGADRLTYVLHQRFEYCYDAPIRDLNHRLVVVPPNRHGDQRLRRHSITVSAADARTIRRKDSVGNTVIRSRVPLVPDRVEFVVEAVVERDRSGPGVLLPAAALTDPRLLRPTRLTAPDPAIRDLAAAMAGSDGLAAAERFCAYVHEAISYAHGVTSIATTAAQALAGGRGVCQDSAHVMIALCRASGLPARYVSGHLLGEGGTHAWVEVIIAEAAGARAVAFDPCNGRRAGMDYLTVATGRDYTDVAPTSGTYLGTARGVLTATKTVGVAPAHPAR
ncbi:MAG TPA: transglutaminase family protein [Actinocrinis sp.]|jgi:transglutaminase-like putative cysteine protease|uniref:transglutaminase family protein n=1 Tax=Actinocrinis sp. TaxID=1920516 RepID=UPI002DDCACBA|nr:transglutaminase family protein [Actinocrinis sp.]HEV3169237.1 transglutaminase family protein [Actinocrinis sp.]